MRGLGAGVLCAVLLVHAQAARGEDTWSTPYPGVEYLHRVNGDPNHIHVLKIDLGRPEFRVRATRSADRGMTTSGFAQQYGCAMAINGDFFSYTDYSTSGLAIGHGEPWADTKDTKAEGFIAAGVDNRSEIQTPMDLLEAPEAWMEDVVGGRPLIVDEGVSLDTVSCDPHFCDRHPRTAVGLSEDNKTLFLLVVDGRRTSSIGMTTKQVGNQMVDVGAWRALNLDGGGSSAMFVDAEGGIVNVPSGPPTAGVQRVVGNHLGIEIVDAVGKLSGMVTSKDDRPLEGATVELSNGDAIDTDADGAFVFDQTAAGTTTLNASLPGYLPGSIDLWVAAQEETTIAIVLEPEPPEAPPSDPQDPASSPPLMGEEADGGCRMSPSPTGGGWWLLALGAAFITRRRNTRREGAMDDPAGRREPVSL